MILSKPSLKFSTLKKKFNKQINRKLKSTGETHDDDTISTLKSTNGENITNEPETIETPQWPTSPVYEDNQERDDIEEDYIDFGTISSSDPTNNNTIQTLYASLFTTLSSPCSIPINCTICNALCNKKQNELKNESPQDTQEISLRSVYSGSYDTYDDTTSFNSKTIASTTIYNQDQDSTTLETLSTCIDTKTNTTATITEDNKNKRRYTLNHNRFHDCDNNDLITDKNYNASIIYNNYGAAKDVIKLALYSSPGDIVKEDDVVIKVNVCTVSLKDCLVRQGLHSNKNEYEDIFPIIPGYECIGVIKKYGIELVHENKYTVGDKVIALLDPDQCMIRGSGSNSNYATVSSNQLLPLPNNMNDADAICMIRVFMTAYQCLHRVGISIFPYQKQNCSNHTLEDKILLVIDAMSPIGQATIQLAKRCKVKHIYAITSKNESFFSGHDNITTYDIYDHKSWSILLQNKVDIIVDTYGYHDIMHLLLQTLKKKSRFVCVGNDSIMHHYEKTDNFDNNILCDYVVNPKTVLAPIIKRNWNLWKAKYLHNDVIFWYDAFESFRTYPSIFKVSVDVQDVSQSITFYTYSIHTA